MTAAAACPLCNPSNETVLWRNALLRVIQVDDPHYPGFCRAIVNRHVKEMTDLLAAERAQVMDAVWTVEAVLRELLAPDKINLASLGNVVPHLHWHVIPRFADDRHFPDPVWAAPRRDGVAHSVDVMRLQQRLAERLGGT
jgi:diadenosine tetraphosphate (Ap4A) HIT family hydrolase